MADQKTILYALEIKGADEQLEKLKALNKQVEELKNEIKAAGNVGTTENEARKIQLAETQKQYKQLQNEVKAEKSAIEGSINTLAKKRAALGAMNKELDNVEIGSKRFKELTAESKKLRDEIKGADEDTGRFQGNVGNYSNAIQDAFQKMGINIKGLTTPINDVASAFQMTTSAVEGTTVATSGLSKAFKILKFALISTGIGAIIVVLGSVVAYLASTQEGIDKINKLLIPLGTILQRTLGIIQDFGGALFKIFSGEAQQGWKDLKKSVSGVGEALGEAWKDGQRLAEITVELGKARIKLAENEARINEQIAEQRGILDDVNQSQAKRKEAGEKYKALQQELLGFQTEIAKLEFEQAKIKSEQNDTDREAQEDLARKQAAVNQLNADAQNKSLEAQNKLNALEKEAANKRFANLKEQRKIEQQLYDSGLENINRINKAYDILLENRKKADDAAMVVFKFDDEEIEEFNATVENVTELQLQELAMAQEVTFSLEQEYVNRLASLKAFLANGLISQEQYNAAVLSLESDTAARRDEINQATIMAAKGLNDALTGLLNDIGGDSEAFIKFKKLLTLTQIAIDTASAISALTAASQANPTNAVTFGAAGTLQFITGLVQIVSNIAKAKQVLSSASEVKAPKFAGGVIGLQGAGSETSDSINAKLSRGESVMTARATKTFAPILAQMELAVGNTPNVQLGNKRFANGFIPQPSVQAAFNLDQVIEKTIKSIGSIPVVVSEQDITSTQKRVVKIKQAGNL